MQLDLKDAVFVIKDAEGRELSLFILDGDLKFTETKNYKYLRNRGLLNTVSAGDIEPLEISFKLMWEYLTGVASESHPESYTFDFAYSPPFNVPQNSQLDGFGKKGYSAHNPGSDVKVELWPSSATQWSMRWAIGLNGSWIATYTITVNNESGYPDGTEDWGDPEPNPPHTGQIEFVPNWPPPGQLNPIDVFKNINSAADWVSTNPDECGPYMVDLVVYFDRSCADKERLTFSQFAYNKIKGDPKTGELIVSGQCNIEAPTAERIEI